MHEKLIKQLRNAEHCCECPYEEDCNEFGSCLMDLLAADAIEVMSKRIARMENGTDNRVEKIIEKLEQLKVNFNEELPKKRLYLNARGVEYLFNSLIDWIKEL